ncbi:hypothetical protein T02_7930 [Trichinella nativa]|uniref:Uncharacterized protein n=1 Tax=Trichinella nativa TaxID=6335 RepID=A0A0V1LH95_9BILA|nr:hypothetical protein T06_9277 [Trichinella sp. T6]KRZ58889.1 hypothetical protein T02_7930 [Trichinella nativa]
MKHFTQSVPRVKLCNLAFVINLKANEVSVLIFCFDQMMLILCVRTNGKDRFRSIPINKVSH